MWGCSFSDKWIEFLQSRGVEVRELNLLAPDALEQAKACDGVMWRWFHIQQDKQSARVILYAIENYLNIPVFPATRTSWHFDDKIGQNYLLTALRAPQPDTWVFWDYQRAIEWVESAPYPVVFKLSAGAGSSNVLKLKSRAEAEKLVSRMFKQGIFPMTMNEYSVRLIPKTRRELLWNLVRPVDAARYAMTGVYPRLPEFWWKPEMGYALFQEFLPGNEFDTRVTVVGDRAFAYRRMNRPGDFRASGSGNFNNDPDKIDLDCVKIAFEISKKAGFQTMAYDFLYRQGKPVVCEISYTFVDWMVQKCPGQWDSNLNWHEGNMWPEEAQVEDFLAEISNKRNR
jgi:glutathione synthase/RimK-type ligase-like ATP-grasp enzyme